MSFYFPLPEKVIKSKMVYDCDKCKLSENNKIHNPKMKPFIGNSYNGLVIVADSPSLEDDIKNIPLINEDAKIVRSCFLKNKVNLVNQSAITYALCCSVKKPTDTQYRCCRDILAERLLQLKPKVIVTLGEMAFKLVMGIKNKIGATKIRNRVVPNFEFNCIVFPMFDPNNISVKKNYHYQFALQKDIERISKLWIKNYSKRTYVNNLLKERKILDNITIHDVKEHEIDLILNQMNQLKEAALDYEATNVKTHDSFFEITHISFGLKQTAWVFHEHLWENNLTVFDDKIYPFMKQFLLNPNIKKIIQNSKFEDLASRHIFGTNKINNVFCTMLSTHVVDERQGCTSLDFQNLMRFGIPPYSDTVKSHLVPKTKDHKVNTIRKSPYDDMILYAGLDVITTFNQYLVLHNEILPNIYDRAYENYEFLLKGHNAFANMTQRGIYISETAWDEIETKLDFEIDNILQQISELPEFQQYNEYLKSKMINNKDGDKEIKKLIENMKNQTIEEKENDND